MAGKDVKGYKDEAGTMVVDLADQYAPNPTPQARYAMNKDITYGLKEDVPAYIKASDKGPKAVATFRAGRDERILKAGREADNEMKREGSRAETMKAVNNKKGGKVCGMKKGGKVRGCGIAERGLTKGKMR